MKEASTGFAAPTYLFIGTVFTMLIVGFVRCADGVCPDAISSGSDIEAEVGAVTLFLLLRAFASGSTALTGVEAVANGVPAFREPRRGMLPPPWASWAPSPSPCSSGSRRWRNCSTSG